QHTQDAPPGERIALGCGEYGVRTPVLGDRLQVGLGPSTLPDRPCRLPVVGPRRATVWLSPNIGYEQADPRFFEPSGRWRPPSPCIAEPVLPEATIQMNYPRAYSSCDAPPGAPLMTP